MDSEEILTLNHMKKVASGTDYVVYFNAVSDALILKCMRCEWQIDLNLLDTLEDIWNELEVHGDVNHGTKTND